MKMGAKKIATLSLTLSPRNGSPNMSFPDISPEAALPRLANASGSQRIPYRDGASQTVAAADVDHDYTEGATPGEIEEVLRQHEAEEVAHLGESAMGMGGEGPNDGESSLQSNGYAI
jgi:hypothetical protein